MLKSIMKREKEWISCITGKIYTLGMLKKRRRKIMLCLRRLDLGNSDTMRPKVYIRRR